MNSQEKTSISSAVFGALPEGETIDLITLRSAFLEVDVMAYGARVVALRTPDRTGVHGDVVLGYGDLSGYIEDKKNFLGCTVGRFANRLAGGRFTLGERTYQVPPNDGPNALHGGPQGFDTRVWDVEEVERGVEFTLVSGNGDQGFPGELTVSSRYTVVGDTVRLEYAASTTQLTVLNLTNHTYFHLGGEGNGTVLDHTLQIEADAFTPVNEVLIPTGDLREVEGTPFDFRSAQRIGEHIDASDEQLTRAKGYDHNWALRNEGGTLRPCATVSEARSGRKLAVQTTELGVQFYSGNFLDGTRLSKRGLPYEWRSGLCLETQHFPDSPNQPAFPSTILRPGEMYRSTTTWTFSADA